MLPFPPAHPAQRSAPNAILRLNDKVISLSRSVFYLELELSGFHPPIDMGVLIDLP
jgi:hypothetical protein